jgi:hypothetical protein
VNINLIMEWGLRQKKYKQSMNMGEGRAEIN